MKLTFISCAGLFVASIGYGGQGTIIITNFVPNSQIKTLTVQDVATKGPISPCWQPDSNSDSGWRYRKITTTYDLSRNGRNVEIIRSPAFRALQNLCGLVSTNINLSFLLNTDRSSGPSQKNVIVDFNDANSEISCSTGAEAPEVISCKQISVSNTDASQVLSIDLFPAETFGQGCSGINTPK